MTMYHLNSLKSQPPPTCPTKETKTKNALTLPQYFETLGGVQLLKEIQSLLF